MNGNESYLGGFTASKRGLFVRVNCAEDKNIRKGEACGISSLNEVARPRTPVPIITVYDFR